MTNNPFLHRVPRRDELYNPVLKAIRALGGSASIRELDGKVINDLEIPDHIAETLHDATGSSNRTAIEYNLAWARTCLKMNGLIDNSARGVWSLIALGLETESVDSQEIEQGVRAYVRQARQSTHSTDIGIAGEKGISETTEYQDDFLESRETFWRETLLDTLKNMSPDAFERLCQRLLRESGFIEVVVTGRPGDGGIDGHGLIRLAGLISFPVLFQCKRYSGNVGAEAVRGFRGAMAGRADKGLILTTGNFTGDAYKEATRDGAPPIDLIDGELLVDKLKELQLGVNTKMVEAVELDTHWFNSL